MTASFTTTELTRNRFLVEGTDASGVINKVVLDGTQYKELAGNSAFDLATEEYDAAVAAFYAPLTDAAEKLEAAREANFDVFSEVVQEAVEPTAGQPEIRVVLTPDTVILRLIEKGDTDRLVWVGDQLEITAA